jgi:hypothetical protein
MKQLQSMKNFLGGKTFYVMALLIIVAMVATVVAFALNSGTTHNVPSLVNITEYTPQTPTPPGGGGGGGGGNQIPTYDTALFADPQRHELTDINFGEIEQGGTNTVTIYIENVGNSNAAIQVSIDEPDIGTITADIATILAGDIEAVTLTLHVASDSPVGTGNTFVTTITSGPIS